MRNDVVIEKAANGYVLRLPSGNVVVREEIDDTLKDARDFFSNGEKNLIPQEPLVTQV